MHCMASAPPEYRREPLKEASQCFPQNTRRDLQAVFRRLAEDHEFRAIETFRQQVIFAKDFVEGDDDVLQAVPNTEFAKFFDVPHSQSIRSVLNARHTGATYVGRPSALSDRDYSRIAKWVKIAAMRSRPLTLGDVVHEVFVRLGKRVTKNGLRIALKRRSIVRFVEATPIQACRLNLDDEEVKQFMEDTEELLRDVPASFVFNMDETGINEYQNAKKKQVVVHNRFVGNKTHYPVARDTKHATVVACIAADGTAVQPLVIVTHRTVREALLRRCWTPDKVHFAHSERGFITHDLFIEWLRTTFIPNVEERRRRIGNAGQRAYLLMDNCSSHRSDDIVELCEENNVELIYFVPNSTHIFQPLDLRFFASFKARIGSAIPEDTDKQTARLLAILQSADAANQVRTIQASFEMAGFIYNIVAGNVLVVSFSREMVRSPEARQEPPPAPRPSGRRIPI